MGSSSSKDGVASSSSSSSSSAIVRRTRSKGANVFQSSCLGRSSGSYDSDNDNQVSDDQNKDHGSLSNETCTVQTETISDQGKRKSCGKLKVLQANEVCGISSDVELDEESVMASGSSTRAASSRSLNSSSRFCSRFSFIPSNISFRLSRAASLGSSRSYPLFSTSLTISNREEFHANTGSTSNFANRNETDPGRNLLQACSINRSPATQYEDTSALSGHLQDGGIVSTQDVTRNSDNTGIGADVNERSSRDPGERENIETRRPDRRIGAREPAERTVRFSRTLSVGRLRDRVLRRSSFSDGLFGRLQEDLEVRDSNESSRGQVLEGLTSTSTSDANAEISPPSSYPPSSMSSSRYANQDYEVGSTLQSRENGYHDITERRTDFLERRRRIRSQVRALQRLGNRFENLSGHERSCILSGQHRTGHCMCRTGNRTNPDDDTSARASISRIVMLAEALFEVLDEIHQQSVVLSSRTSVSSIGSVPAPKEVVDSMPVKVYSKSHKHQIEEGAQCYICLVEYEEGDCMRILPCHHEFHQSCIDKWLKEIHRVCPLCRGDVCRSDSLPLPVEN